MDNAEPPPSGLVKRANLEIKMEPLTPLETLCRIILRAREYEAQVPTDYDGGEAPENVDNGGEETLSVLDDSINTAVEEELNAAFDDLADDQLAEVLAFCWVGQGTYEASDWDEAFEEATSETNIADELMDMPMLASVLEAGMAAFEISCDGIGDVS
jgi:hypothetical protein